MSGSAFISYVREDAAAVQHLAADLVSLGVNTWLDRESIKPGEPWKIAIRTALTRGGCFVACFSANYEARDNNYMDEEITFAVEIRSYQGRTTNWFVPVVLSRCVLPAFHVSPSQVLADLNLVDLTDNWERGVRQIADLAAQIETLSIATQLKRHRTSRPGWTLRSEPLKLTDREVTEMIKDHNFYERDYNPSRGAGALALLQFIDSESESVALDVATGLLWQVDRNSVHNIPHRDTDAWIARLNRACYAGFDTWRLPTLPEAMSLIETGGHHDHRFGLPLSVWTSDVTEEGGIWVVGYHNGDCGRVDTHDFNRLSVRAVCSWLGTGTVSRL